MRKAIRGLVIKNDELLVMHRNKFGREYYTLLGGGLDLGESMEECLHREIREESMVEIGNERLVFVEHAGDPFGDQYIYLCDYVGGEPKLPEDSIEAKIAKAGKNLYTPMWLGLDELNGSPFLSETLKQAILKGVKEGFPKDVTELHSSAEVRYTDKAKKS